MGVLNEKRCKTARDAGISVIAVSANGKYIACGDYDGILRIIERNEGAYGVGFIPAKI